MQTVASFNIKIALSIMEDNEWRQDYDIITRNKNNHMYVAKNIAVKRWIVVFMKYLQRQTEKYKSDIKWPLKTIFFVKTNETSLSKTK